jgi:CheY-like chemotaxis protein
MVNDDLLPVPPTRVLRILVVEDNPDVAESTALLLRMDGFEVDLADSFATAHAAVLAQRPDVLLIDIGLPIMDGYQVAINLRGLFPQKPLMIAVTGYDESSDEERSGAAGFDHHFVKPVPPGKLLAILKAYGASL